MSYDSAIQVLKAAADPTRFRLLSMLRAGEATVGELQSVLQQSQPRVSRHLRLLDEAGLVHHFRDGQWMYYRLETGPQRTEQITRLLALAGEDPAIEQDRQKLEQLKRARENEALQPVTSRNWIRRRLSEHRPDARALSSALDDALAGDRYASALLVGCASGTLLNGVAKNSREVVATDDSKSARLIARSRIHQSEFANTTVRNAHATELPYADASFDLVVLNEVLGATTQSRETLVEAVRVLRPEGCLIIFDRIRPVATRLPTRQGGDALVENQLSAWLSEAGCRITNRHWFAGRVLEYAMFTVSPTRTPL